MKQDTRHPMDIERTLQEMKTLRVEHNLSQDDLANLIGVDRSYISKWENGVVRPEFHHLVMLHRILHGLKLSAGV